MYKTKKTSRSTKTNNKPIIKSIFTNIELSLPPLTPSPYNTSSSSDCNSESENIPIGYRKNNMKKSFGSLVFQGLELEKKTNNIYGFTSDEDNDNEDSYEKISRKKIISQKQQHRKKTTFQKLDAMSIVEIRIMLGNEETKLLVTAGILHKREEEMKTISLLQQQQEEEESGKMSTNWNGSLICQECSEQISNETTSKKKKKQVIIQIPDKDNFTIELIQITLHRFFQDGIIYCNNQAKGNDILKFLEYFQILYQPNQMQFESIGCYLRVRMWAHYFLNRTMLKDYILNEIVHGNGSSGVKVRRGVGFVVLEEESESTYIYKGRKLLEFDVDLVIDLFAPHCDDNDEEEDGEVGIDEILRQDFSSYLQENLHGTSVTFRVEDVKRVYDSNVIGLSSDSCIEKYAVLYVDFYPRSATKPSTPSVVVPIKQKPIKNQPKNSAKQQESSKLLVPDALSVDQKHDSSSEDEDDDVVQLATKKMAEMIGSISDTDASDEENEHAMLSCINEGNRENDSSNSQENDAVAIDDSANGSNKLYEHSLNTPIKNNMTSNDNNKSDNESNLNDIKTSLKYSYFRQIQNSSPKQSDLDSFDNEVHQKKNKEKMEQSDLTPKKNTSKTVNLPPPPTPISPTNVADIEMVHSTTQSESTAETKNTTTKNKEQEQPKNNEDETTVGEEDNKSTITNLWMVDKEENFDILEWYQNLWDLKSITSFTSAENKNEHIIKEETGQAATELLNDQQSFIGPIFSFASDDGDIASVLTGTIMSHQEAMEDNVLDSFEKMSSSGKKENVSCFGSSSCIPLVNYNQEGNNWLCSNVLDSTMEFTMKLCDLNYSKGDGKVPAAKTNVSDDNNSIIDENNTTDQ